MKRKRNKDMPLPLKLVKQFEEEYLGCYASCDDIMENVKNEYTNDEYVYVPIAATLSIMDIKYNAKLRCSELHSLYSWRREKQIFVIDDDLLEEIIYSDYSIVPVDSLYSLPFKSFYISCMSSDIKCTYYNFKGFFVSFDFDENNYNVPMRELRIMAITDELGSIAFWLPLIKDCTIEEALLQSREYRNSDMNSLINMYIKTSSKTISELISIILYLCCDNADISEDAEQKPYTKRQTNPKMIKDHPREIQKWDVGWVIGAKLKKYKASNDIHESKNKQTEQVQNDEQKPGTSKRPHIRAAHYHHFWTGKKDSPERKLIMKWIPATVINCDSKNELAATIRYVTK